MQTHDLEAWAVPCPARYRLLRERLRDVLAERRKWTAMPQLLDELDACRRGGGLGRARRARPCAGAVLVAPVPSLSTALPTAPLER